MIRVLLVDDQPIVRSGLSMILEVIPDIEVVGEATDGRDAIERVRQVQPDVVLMDVRMPNMDGIEATRLLMNDPTNAGLSVVMLTTFDLDEYVVGALRAGAKGFLLKDADGGLIAEAIRAAARGDGLIDPAITLRFIASFTQQHAPKAEPLSASLTDREFEVLEAISSGLSNAEIADLLFVSVSTVKTHVASLLTKTECRDRVQLVILAYEYGIAVRSPQ
jgi:DNA-binding NarL/FixJ family response regulator